VSIETIELLGDGVMVRIIRRKDGFQLAVAASLFLAVMLLAWGEALLAQTGGGDPTQAQAAMVQARAWEDNGQYLDAQKGYRSVMDLYPGTDEAGKALVGLAGTVIHIGDAAQAEQIWQLATTEYAGQEAAARAVLVMADNYAAWGKHAEARQMYQRVVDTWPGSPIAAEGQAGVAICAIRAGDDAAAKVALDRLVSRYGSRAHAAAAAYEVVETLHDAGKTEQAERLAGKIANWPATGGRIWGKAAQAVVAARQGQGRLQITQILDTMAGQTESPRAAHRLAQACLERQQYDLAYALCDAAAAEYGTDVPLELRRDQILAQIGKGDIAGAEHSLETLSVAYPSDYELALAMNKIAAAYRASNHTAQAQAVQEQILRQWTGPHNEVLTALTELAHGYVEQGRYEEAQQMAMRIMNEYKQSHWQPHSVLTVAQAFREHGRMDRAIALYASVLQTQNGATDPALTAITGMAVSELLQNEPNSARVTLERMVTEFAANRWLSFKLVEIADAHRKAGNAAEALDLFRYVEENWPDGDMVMWCQLGRLAVHLANDDWASAQTLCTSMKEIFAQDARLAVAYTEMAGAYIERGNKLAGQGDTRAKYCYTMAVEEATGAIEITQKPKELSEACFLRGNAYGGLRSRPEAIESYRMALKHDPYHKHAGHMWFMIGRYYQELGAEGLVPRSEAETQIAAAYRQVVDVFPHCPAAEAARRWLEEHSR
jgi:tetratricopeptide (TPR) repeat protein